jgi:uncharacterized membrane protein
MNLAVAWRSLLASPVDAIGVGLFLLVFPIYHALYPWLIRFFPNRAAKVRIDAIRRSWIEGVLERGDIITAVQQTRNLTMVNSMLGSSSLILIGLTANLLVRWPDVSEEIPHAASWAQHADTAPAKLLLLILVFAVAFSYSMASLRHLGHFNLVIGAAPEVIEQFEPSSVDYVSNLINRASGRYTLAVRCLFSASPLFLWLFEPYLFVALTVFWGLKFVVLQDFAHAVRGR